MTASPPDPVPLRKPPLRVGLVNNMPDGALAATERQFSDLVRAAADGRPVELSLFSIPEISRGPAGAARIARDYRPTDAIADAGLDALIVTGAEAKDPALNRAPFWPRFARLVETTEELGLSTLWSCLAAHAAVLKLDGIERRRLPAKRSGVFRTGRVADHPLLEGLGSSWRIPHSRFNEVFEEDLAPAGYTVLTRGPEAGADLFVREGPARFVFLQGHPEYDANSLLLEYKRDLKAYFRRERELAPQVPAGAFRPELAGALERLAAAVPAHAGGEAFAGDPPGWPSAADAACAEAPWRGFAEGVIRNWLADLG